MKLYQADSFEPPFYIRFFFTSFHLVFLHLSLQKSALPQHADALPMQAHDYPSWFQNTVQQVKAYLKGETTDISTPYQFVPNKIKWQSAWEALSEIPYGQTTSYKSYSQRIGLKNPRNAGWVLSQNPLPLVFPCHRVIRTDGSLGGFTPDPKIKKLLIDLEQTPHD